MYDPSEDGKTHLNVYSKGRTEVGRFLTNLAHTPFEHPIWGPFQSVEGFWYWYFSPKRSDKLRELHGVEAKMVGRVLSKRKDNKDGFAITPIQKSVIREVIRFKVRKYPEMWPAIARTEGLPFVHYYVVPGGGIIDMTEKYQWVMDELTDIRSKLVSYYQDRKGTDVRPADQR